MKTMIVFLLLLGIEIPNAHTQKMKNLTKAEKSFVRNVINIQGQEPIEITKRNDNHIVVEFEFTMVVLRPDGYVGEMWILEDGDWMSLGTEASAY